MQLQWHPLCSSQLITAPSLHYPCPPVESLHSAGRAHMASYHILGGELWYSSHLQRSGLLLRHHVSKCKQQLPPPHPGSTPRPGRLCIPWSSLFPGCGCSSSSASLWHGVTRAETCAWPGLGLEIGRASCRERV